MSGKGIQYWESVWNERNCYTTSQRSDRLLKRYAHLWTATTYGKDVYSQYYFGGKPLIRRTLNQKSCASAVDTLTKALNNRPIKEDGDLHQILQVFSQKDNTNYLQYFNIEKRPSIWNSLSSSFFCCFRSHKDNEDQNLIRNQTAMRK